MAGDWIKMRGNLWDDPRVASLVDATDTSEAQVVGGLYWLWATADQHTEDGCMPGLTLRQIDRKTGIPGFGAALVAIGWLEEAEHGVVLMNFTEHNGSSAKRRATDAQRKANIRTVSASGADKPRTQEGQEAPNLGAREREEKRREEETTPIGVGAADAPTPPVAPKARPAKRCPDDFTVTDEMRSWATTEAPGVDVDRATAKFRDHTFSTARTDWPATWRNWLRKDSESAPGARRVMAANPGKHAGFGQLNYTAGVNADGTLA